MRNNKRLMLEGVYVTGNQYLYSKEVRDMIEHHTHNIKRHKTYEFGGKHYTYLYRPHSILSHYENQVSLASCNLIKAKEKANKVFTEYMDLKKEIMESGAYADPEIRNIFNKKKAEWRDVSMDVIRAKTFLYSCEIDYNGISEYINSTIKYIKFLEQNYKEKV